MYAERHRRDLRTPPAGRATACSRPPPKPARSRARSGPSASTPTSTRRPTRPAAVHPHLDAEAGRRRRVRGHQGRRSTARSQPARSRSSTCPIDGVGYATSGDNLSHRDDRRHARGLQGSRSSPATITVPTAPDGLRRLTSVDDRRPRAGSPSFSGCRRYGLPAAHGPRRSARNRPMTDTTTERAVAIELRDIVKRFPASWPTTASTSRSCAGTIHAIVGENGAGKSTLMKTLYGAHRPDEGTIIVNGAEQHFRSPRDAHRGRHRDGVPALHAGRQLHGLGEHRARRRAGHAVEPPARDRDPPASATSASGTGSRSTRTRSSSDLGVGEKQRVEILKVLYRGAKIIILDEPTAVLVPQEVDELFASLRELTAAGVDGRSSSPTSSTRCCGSPTRSRSSGPARPSPRCRPAPGRRPPAGRADGRQRAALARDTREHRDGRCRARRRRASPSTPRAAAAARSTTSRSRSTAARSSASPGSRATARPSSSRRSSALAEARRRDGSRSSATTSRRRRYAGIVASRGSATSPRTASKDGLVLPFPLWENACSATRPSEPFGDGIWIDKAGAVERTERDHRRVRRAHPVADVPALTLSGGNQQKLIVGREMTADPKVLIAAHPTRGIDVGAQAAIWDVIRARAGRRARRAADLGRPRGADRAVRHAAT